MKDYITEEIRQKVNEKMKDYLLKNNIPVVKAVWHFNDMSLDVKSGKEVIAATKFYKEHQVEIKEYFLSLMEECNIKESVVGDYLEFSRKISGKCEEKENEFFFGMTFYPDIDIKVNLFIRKNKTKASRIIKDLLPGKVSRIYCHSFIQYEDNFCPCGFNVFIKTMENYEALDDKQQVFLREEFIKRIKEFDFKNIISKETLQLTFLPAKDKNGKNLIEYGFTRED